MIYGGTGVCVCVCVCVYCVCDVLFPVATTVVHRGANTSFALKQAGM